VYQYSSTSTLGGGSAKPPGPMGRLRAWFFMAIMVVVGAIILAGILAVGLVLLPIVLLGSIIGWFLIRRRIRQAMRAMEEPTVRDSGRENVRVRGPAQGDR